MGDINASTKVLEESLNQGNNPLDSVGPLYDDEMKLHDLESQLLVIEDQIVQVLMISIGAHKFIEDIMWKSQLE